MRTRIGRIGARYRPRVERVQQATFDGLGDRSRSLSPDGDGVWDTLLSSITADPVPPSAGSSFASASASAAASQTTSVNTSSTSLTIPAAIEDGPVEISRSVCDSDTENDDDHDDGLTLTRIRRRSYADVASTIENNNDESLELMGMQRIVRSLARRQDIPDEWWAEAGLSRTLGREESG